MDLARSLRGRVRRERVLDHPVRAAIHDFIQRLPGVSPSHLLDKLRASGGLGRRVGVGSLYHHLERLERFGLVLKRESGKWVRYYPAGLVDAADASGLAVLQRPQALRVARAILDAPGSSVTRLTHALVPGAGRTRQNVSRHLRILRHHVLVESTRLGNDHLQHPTPRLVRLMHLLGSASPPQTSIHVVSSVLDPVGVASP